MINISIIMPCYNCEKTLERAVKSIINQEYWHELIMVNDGSTDNTFELIKQLSTLDSRIQIHNLDKNSGAALARNIASKYATGNVLGFLDADDEHLPNIYKLAQEFLHSLPQIAAVRFGTNFAGFPADVLTSENQNKLHILLNTFIPNLFIRKTVFDLLGGFPNHPTLRKYGGEDGVLSYLLQSLFLVGTNYENQGLIHHWHENVHAEKFLRTDLTKDSSEVEVVQISNMLIHQKLEELNIIVQQIQNRQNVGFIPVFKTEAINV